MSIIEFKQEFQGVLDKALEKKFSEYTLYTQDEEILSIITYTRAIIGGGKCIRPYMAYMMYKTLGGDNLDTVMDMLVSLELFHAFALIHDDIIDEGKTRHRVDTIHTFVSDGIKEYQKVKNPIHYGHSQAILIGDLLFSWSIGRFHQFNMIPHYYEAWTVFYQMIDEVAIGQMIDVNVMTRDSIDSGLIETKMRLKTAGYTFVRPMQIGVILAGKQQDLEEFCIEFGTALGLAFQTQDDILDIIADPAIIKKSVLSDIKDHQHTFLTQYVLENGTEQDKQELYAFWGENISDIDQEAIIALFERTGALSYARAKVDGYLAQARQICINENAITDDTRNHLTQLIEYIAQRGY
jgi:geranylgeranyl diphosphate synthase type I